MPRRKRRRSSCYPSTIPCLNLDTQLQGKKLQEVYEHAQNIIKA